MKAYTLTKHGKPSVLKITEIPDPNPNAGEIRIKIKRIGINYAEILPRPSDSLLQKRRFLPEKMIR